MKSRLITQEEFDLLTEDEMAGFAYRADEAFRFKAVVTAAVFVALIGVIVGVLVDSLTLGVVSGLCFIGFIVTGIVSNDLHHNRFSRDLFNVIDEHKNKGRIPR